MALLTKQKTLHSITPFYYFQLKNAQNSFNNIIEASNVGMSIPFIEAIEEIVSLTERIYKEGNLEGVTPEELAVLQDTTIETILVGFTNFVKDFGSLKRFKIIKERNMLDYEVDNDIAIGRVPLSHLMKENERRQLELLDGELSNIKISSVDNLTGDVVGEAIVQLEQLYKNTTIATELLQRRIDRISGNGINISKDMLEIGFKDVLRRVDALDNIMIKFIDVRQKLSLLGMDTETQLYHRFKNNERYISSLHSSTYSNKPIPILERNKKNLDNFRISIISRIEAFKGETGVPEIYF